MAERNAVESVPKLALSGPIDAHVHVWTTDFEHYPLANGFTPSQMSPTHFTPDDLFALSQPLGVKRTVLIQMVFYGDDNSYMLGCIRKYPGTFAGVALIDEHGPDPSAEMRQLRKLGVRGIRIVPPHWSISGWLDGLSMRKMWDTAADCEMAMCCLVNPEDLPAVERMCHQNPDTRVVIDHCARIGGDGVFRQSDVDQLCDLAQHRNTFTKLSAFYFLGAKHPPYVDLLPMIRLLVDAFGPDRLMWATDCPFQVVPPHTYTASLELIRDRLDFVTAADRDQILEQTAERLFFT